ncbi:MAG TPA: hypothetical protein VN901_31645, partial [Candidatus Acidoferrales bacterium]|nr:hypothetical protein [Candidatus Acidoferrales bacterium]
FQTTYYLNGHSFIEQELNRAQVGFRKNDNAFLAVDDVAALQAAADRLEHFSIRLDVSRVREISVAFFFGNTFEKRGDCSPKLLNCARFHFA